MSEDSSEKKQSKLARFFKGPEDPAVATFSTGSTVFTVYKGGDVAKLMGADKGRQSLAGATVELEDGAEFKKRITATRVLATGVFALALKKKSGGEKWLLISGPDFEWLEEIPRKKDAEAVRFVQAVRKVQRELERAA